jgi:hypothetical protein
MPTLQIGDQQNAILFIQQSQTDPQKAVAELVENSIDANARNITLVRARKGMQVSLVIRDDGDGVPAAADGEPDMDYVATHICDSVKRRLGGSDRNGVQGQFGIGLLGFAAIGEELVLRTMRHRGRTRSIRLHAYRSDYELDRHPGELDSKGTEVEVLGVHRSIQNRLTAEKLQRYLSEELRDRIRSSSVRIVVEDRVGARKKLLVRAREFTGIPLTAGHKVVSTSLGPLKLDLYLSFPREGEAARVAVARKGTRLLSDLLEVEELNHAPWNMNALEGIIDYEALNPAPTTRHRFMPDDASESMIEELRRLEPGILLEVEKLRDRQRERLTKEALEKLQKAFAEAMEELPDEYSWFEMLGSGVPAPGKRPSGSGGKRAGLRISLHGPLAEVRIAPRIAVIGPGETRSFLAKAFDPDGALILTGVSFEWSSTAGAALLSLRSEGPAAHVEAKEREGEAGIRVIARHQGKEAFGEAKIVITKSQTQYQFPPPEEVRAPQESWRSRYRSDTGVIEINSGHRDYERAARDLKGKIRYISKLYAKELVLLNFGGVPPSQLLEHMVEVTSILEPKL